MIAALNAWSLVAVAAAGAACGLVNTIAGGGSLILFPTLLLTGSVLFPLNDNGLKPGVTPVIGIDYGFGH